MLFTAGTIDDDDNNNVYLQGRAKKKKKKDRLQFLAYIYIKK